MKPKVVADSDDRRRIEAATIRFVWKREGLFSPADTFVDVSKCHKLFILWGKVHKGQRVLLSPGVISDFC